MAFAYNLQNYLSQSFYISQANWSFRAHDPYQLCWQGQRSRSQWLLFKLCKTYSTGNYLHIEHSCIVCLLLLVSIRSLILWSSLGQRSRVYRSILKAFSQLPHTTWPNHIRSNIPLLNINLFIIVSMYPLMVLLDQNAFPTMRARGAFFSFDIFCLNIALQLQYKLKRWL